MNKTLSIALAGFSFNIEEHAYIKLGDYLNALRSSLDASEADEVMHDIEIRMVEIFRDHLAKREVINDSDVERVIAQIGSPEIIEEQEEAYYSDKNYRKERITGTTYTGKKQLFRDPERQKIAGVCSGLAHYTGLDIRTMRAIWLTIFLLGIFTAAISSTLIVAIYVILWIILPTAETAADFLKMKGKPINFDNIKNESTKLVQFANESSQRVGEIYLENKPYIQNAGSGIWNVIKYILGAIFIVMAVCSIAGTFVVFGLFGVDNNFPGSNEMRFYFGEEHLYRILSSIIVIGSLIPALLFTLLSIKIFSPKTKLKNIGWVLGALVILLMGLGTYFGLQMVQKDSLLKGHKTDTEEVMIPSNSDTIYVDVKQIAIPQNFIGYDDDLYSDKKMVYSKEGIDVEVTRKADVKTPYLIIRKDAKGYNIPLKLYTPVEIVDNKIILPNFIRYAYEERFRDYEVQYELVVPQSAKVISLNTDEIDLGDDSNGDYSEIKVGKDKITINGSTIEDYRDSRDSIIINGKKYPKEKADSITDSIKNNFKKSGKLNISINSDDDEVTIKTGK